MMVIGGGDCTSIISEYFNPGHLGARSDVFSPDLNLTQLETPLQGRITRRITNWFLLVPAGYGSYLHIRLPAVSGSSWFRVLSSDQTFCSPWFLLVQGPILKSDFLQSLVPAGLRSYPQIRLPAVPGYCWYWVLSSDQIPAVFGSAGSGPKVDVYNYRLLLILGLHYTSSLNNLRTQWGQPSPSKP
ncbi:hypothetical protein Bca52824_033088 [Brassica carinata]|uniref:Uncharacterized protein n=1 Tax=Brassica carinata TaxID=52824 RepID=A0A8X7SEC1_BRACI|nr:hypothetical protein Bca52824_033088 [Brassica carinata]